jgi:hypothetical protein
MADQPQMVTISVSGTAGEHRKSWAPRLRWPAPVRRARREDIPPTRGEELTAPPEYLEELATVEKLNAASGEICAEIERQIKKLIGPEISIQAEISFSSGSIIVEGTVILLCWSGNLLLEGLKKEVGDLVRVPIKRVLAEVLTQVGGNASRLEIETSVRSRSVERAPTMETLAPAKAGSMVQLPVWTNTALVIIAVGILFLVADRLVSEWPSRPVLTTATSHPAAP